MIPETFEVALLPEVRLSLWSRIEVSPILGQLPVDGHQEACHQGRTVVSYRSGREKKMYSAPGSIRAVAFLVMSSLSGTLTFSQGVKFIRHAADPLPLANMSSGRAPC